VFQKWYHQAHGGNFLKSQPISNFFLHSKEMEHSKKLKFQFSKGSAATLLKCGGKNTRILLEISFPFHRWKTFEKSLSFDEVTNMSLVAPFLQHGVQRRVFFYIKVEMS